MNSITKEIRRNALSDHEAMIDAQGLCVPCKLCGGSAEITDAGTGAGYYIRCENAQMFRPSKGCIISDQRLGGWAYNVMEWWNCLHGEPLSAGEAVQPVTNEFGEPFIDQPAPASAGVVPDGWMPIETAPISNGSNPFLAYITGHGASVCYAGAGRFIYSSSDGRRIHRATHWQPLPAAPAEGGKP